MLFLCYPKCSTCKKAQKWLDEHQLPYTVRDIKEDNPTLQELETWHQASGLPLKKFFNTSGQLYRSLGLPEDSNAAQDILEESIIRRHYGTIVMDSEQPQGGGTSAGGMAQGIQAAPDSRKTVFRP